MRHRIIILLLTITGIFSQAFAADEAQFNVATYNLRQINSHDTRKGNGWKQRAPIVAGLIRFHEFHIFGTQEGFKSQLADLKAMLPGYDYIGVAREDGKEKGEHSAIFYDTAMFELLDHGDFWLSETPDRPELGWDAACVRICTWGKFRHRPSGRVFQMFNLHLDHVGERARVESVRLVQEKMKEIGVDLPTFLTGDFNVDQTDDAYAELARSGFLTDAYEAAEMPYALNGTFNDYKTAGYTDSRIDHIFVTGDISVNGYGVLTDSYRTPDPDSPTGYMCRVPSDHYPVKIRVKLK